MAIRKSIIALFFLSFLLPAQKGVAQFYNGYNTTFGKNRIQFNEERIWSQFRFDAFDFLFYQDGRKITINAAKYASVALNDISEALNYQPKNKIHFIVFNSLSELKSSNIGLDNEVLYNTGGITQVVDNKAFLCFDGNYLHLEQQIRGGIARVIISQMLYGDELSANIKNSTFMTLPEWYVNGLVSYFSQEWSSELDEKMRDAFSYGKLKKFNHLEGTDATLAGHSVWKYIADRYGANMIPNIIYMTKVSRNVENGFLFVLGISFKNLIRDWWSYNSGIYADDVAGRTVPPESNIPLKIKKKNFYYQAKASPDGKYISYVLDKVNKKKLFLLNLETGKKKKLCRVGIKMDEIPDMSYPITAWHPTSELLAWEVEKKGRRVLNLYNLNDDSRESFNMENINKVLDMAYSPDGSVIAMSAVINGYSDILLYYPGSQSFSRVTNDIYDDLQPRFINQGRLIAFSSNRVEDTLVLEQETYLSDYSQPVVRQQNFDIFAYDVKTKSPVLRRLSNTPTVSETSPMPYNQSWFSYISDENGISNLSVGFFDSTIAYVDTAIHYRYFSTVYPVTNYSSGIREFETYANSSFNTSVFTVGKVSRMVVSDKADPSEFSSAKSPDNTFWAEERLTKLRILMAEKDTLKTPSNKNDKQGFIKPASDSSEVNVYNYKFSTSHGKANKTVSKTSQQDTGKTSAFVLPHQLNYDVEYTIEKLVSQLDFSFLDVSYQPFSTSSSVFSNSGNTALFQMSIADLLEDKRISGVVRSGFTLDNNEYYISYEDLFKRLDKQIVVHRQTYDDAVETYYIKHHLHDFNYILKWPFSSALALRGTALVKYDNQVYKSIDDGSMVTPDIHTFWAGTKFELIFDNTRSPMMNILYGLRYKVFAEYYQGINKAKLNLITAGFDFRHYSKIHRTFIWANRIAFGTSFGSTRLLYFLGGTDKTFYPTFNSDQPVDTSMNFAFMTLATNMRGFPQNIRNGNSFAVINSELRFPVFRYLLNRPIKSQFVNNFQLVGFGDLGSAWLGLNPFSEKNIMVPEVYYQKPIEVIVKTPRNPLVGGVGLGVRSTIMGYFIRFDVAWGIEELHVYAPRYVLSFSLDF